MAFKIEWRPVLQPIALREYHEGYGTETIMVCVNPTREFMQDRNELIQKNRELTEAMNKAGTEEEKIARPREYLQWYSETFLPKMQDWFARLWSYGSDQWTADDLNAMHETDAHLLEWLKNRSMEMIVVHARGIKKN